MQLMFVPSADFLRHLSAFGWVVFAFVGTFLLFLWVRIEVFRMSNADALRAVHTTLVKASGEIVGKIDDLQVALEEALANGGTVEDLSGPIADLVAVAESLDAIVPDAVVDEDGDEDVLDPEFGRPHD